MIVDLYVHIYIYYFLNLLFQKYSDIKSLKYMAGLLITYVALNLMDGHGQPALLYIVPFTLGNFVKKHRETSL